MSEQEQVEEAVEQEVPEQEAPEQEAAPEQDEPEEKPTGKEFLDFNELPPEVRDKYEARFKRLYGHVKESNRALEMIAKDHKAVIERLSKLESGDLESRIGDLQSRQKQAYEEGDFDRAQEIGNQILDHKLAAKEKTSEATEIQVPEFKEENSGPLSEDHMASLAAWARETAQDGTPLRPWAKPGHPDHNKAMQYIIAAGADPDLAQIDEITGALTETSFRNVLQAVDKRMNGGKAAPRTAAVLSGNGDGRPASKRDDIKVTPELARVAEQMGYEPKEYAKLMQKVNSGAR